MIFDPNSLRYDASGVPYLRARAIELAAYELLAEYEPRTLYVPGPAPLVEVLDGLKRSSKLQHQWANLGSKGGTQILGKVSFPEKVIFLDPILDDAQKAFHSFTTAHQIGHWVLHRHKWKNLRLEGGNRFQGVFEDNEKSLGKLDPETPREWLEYHANVFAACLVMPGGPFQQAVLAAQRQMNFTHNEGTFHPASADQGAIDYPALVSALAGAFQVSRAAVEVRFRAMFLMMEESGEPESVISQIVTKSAHAFPRGPIRSRS